MATCGDIVNRALRKLGRLGSGRDPRTVDATDTLNALRGLYTSLIAVGAFGRLSDVIPTADYVAGENERVFRDTDATLTITLPETMPMYREPRSYPDERDAWNYGTNYENVAGNVRPPRDGAVVQIADSYTGESETFVYDGSLRQWQSLDGLGLGDSAPRSSDDPEGLAAMLAMEVADQFGAELSQAAVMQANRYKSSLVNGFSRPRQAAVGVYC